MYEITEKIVTQYVVTCPDGEVTFEEKPTAELFVKLRKLATPLTIEQVAAWSAIGSCPNCGGNEGNGDLEIQYIDLTYWSAKCYVCGTKFDLW